MSGDRNAATPPIRPQVQIWDSHYEPVTHAFDRFREAVCSAFMPWTLESAEDVFEGRIQTMTLGDGAVGRVDTSPIIARKTKGDIARSPVECIYGNYVYSGEIRVERVNDDSIARAGDLILHHSHLPVTLTEKPDRKCDNLAFVMPLSQFETLTTAKNDLRSTVVPARSLPKPLTGCFDMMASGLSSSSADDISALLDACACLIPLSLGKDETDPEDQRRDCGAMLRDIRRFVDRNIADPGLTPRRAAKHFSVSSRYVHKLFARSGTTFGGYVMAERLERVRTEIVATQGSRMPISAHAFRWGFSDISTFNRAFKRRFGRTPKGLRQ